MLPIELIAASVVAAVIAGADGLPQQPTTAPDAVYADFMKLSVERRRNRFSEMSPENKSLIVRTHAERWLAANRARLRASEVGIFEELIALITPQRYAQPAKGTDLKEELAVMKKMTCRVSPNDVGQAFGVRGTPPFARGQEPWTYLDRAKCWVQLIAEELVDYLPRVRRSSRPAEAGRHEITNYF